MTRRSSTTFASLLLATAVLGVACSSDDNTSSSSTSAGSDSTTGSTTGNTDSTTDSTTKTTTSTDRTTSSTTGGGSGELVAYRDFESCEDFLEWTKAEMLERVTPYGLDYGYYPYWEDGRDFDVPVEAPTAETTAAADQAVPAATVPEAGGGTSTTNTQEVGVDEGDLTETDGRFVYSVLDDHLRSVDLDSQALISDIELTVGDHQLILYGDRLLVVTQDWSTGNGDTVAATYAITDGALSFESASHLEGGLVAVRSIDGVARIVMQQPFATRLPFVQPRFGDEDEEEAALEENRRIIEEATA